MSDVENIPKDPEVAENAGQPIVEDTKSAAKENVEDVVPNLDGNADTQSKDAAEKRQSQADSAKGLDIARLEDDDTQSRPEEDGMEVENEKTAGNEAISTEDAPKTDDTPSGAEGTSGTHSSDVTSLC